MTDIASTSLTPEEELERLAPKATPLDRIQRTLHKYPAIGPFAVLVVACIVFGLLNSRFTSSVNIGLMLQQAAVVACLGIAQTLVILTAGIDLSIGAAMILAQLYMAQLAANAGLPGLLALLLGLLVGLLTGAVNGAIITRFRIPPFIATLGTLSVFTSMGLIYSNGQTTQASQLPGIINWAGNSLSIGSLTIINGVIVVFVLYLIVNYILTRTTWGRHIFAVGDDPEAARLAGIRTNLVLFGVYVFAGLIIGIAAWVSIGYTGAASPNNAVDANLQSITAVVIGGTSLFGGRGGVIGTLFGALIVVAFNTGLTLASVNDLYQPMALGILVILAVAVDQWIRRART